MPKQSITEHNNHSKSELNDVKRQTKLKNSILVQQNQSQENDSNEAHSDDEDDQENIEGLDYSEIQQSGKKMQVLKEILSSIPPYLFMSPAEKRKYFKQINSRFQEVMQKEKGSRCSHSRSVKFNLQNN